MKQEKVFFCAAHCKEDEKKAKIHEEFINQPVFIELFKKEIDRIWNDLFFRGQTRVGDERWTLNRMSKITKEKWKRERGKGK